MMNNFSFARLEGAEGLSLLCHNTSFRFQISVFKMCLFRIADSSGHFIFLLQNLEVNRITKLSQVNEYSSRCV